MTNLKIATINVNGIRAASLSGKAALRGLGLDSFIKNEKPDIICMQELKATRSEIVEAGILELLGINSDGFFMQDDQDKKGHAGVGIAVINPNIKIISTSVPFEENQQARKVLSSGRWIEAELDVTSFEAGAGTSSDEKNSSAKNSSGTIIKKITVISAYIHHADSPTVKLKNGQLIDRKKSETTMNNKHIFMSLLSTRLKELQAENRQFVVTGDYNIAHTELDIKNAEGNLTKAGFLPEERIWMDYLLLKNSAVLNKDQLKTFKYNEKIDYKTPALANKIIKTEGLGLRDVFREFIGDERIYSWWTYMGRAFDNNAGWRLDYQMATPKLADTVVDAKVSRCPSWDGRFSDHAPVVVTYNL
ncbi:MAG: endonuclease/exonuclease/phosphatase family protein [Bifidobacteriaceae bacterium]|nr:endonuclease/exonuclease/phosphatase family protein [Bifidobacteriaceae bacterium]